MATFYFDNYNMNSHREVVPNLVREERYDYCEPINLKKLRSRHSFWTRFMNMFR